MDLPQHVIPLRSAPQARPVDPEWQCQHSGDCCTLPPEVVMTKQEAAAMVHAAPSTIALQFRDAGNNFVALKARPCPMFVFKHCLVYDVRPYNCRRFGCMRPDPAAEPFELDGGNMIARVGVSRIARRIAVRMQTKAQRWARKMGWAA